MGRPQGFRRGALLLAAAAWGGGCGDEPGPPPAGATTGSASGSGEPSVMMNAAPVARAEVDVAEACTAPTAARVQLRATLQGCVKPLPAPCTLPEPPRFESSEPVECASAPSTATLELEITREGRYRVELLTLAEDDAELATQCWGVAGETELVVDAELLEAKPTLEVALIEDAACG